MHGCGPQGQEGLGTGMVNGTRLCRGGMGTESSPCVKNALVTLGTAFSRWFVSAPSMSAGLPTTSDFFFYSEY